MANPPTTSAPATPPPPSAPRRSVIASTARGTRSVVVLAFFAGVSYLGYQLARSHVAARVYEQRLVETTEERNAIAQQYNKAITLTAVTELEVGEEDVCVNIRTADGGIERHEVDVDPANDIYVDYVVKNGRLLIRRVFDSTRAPDDAGAIDSDLLTLDWNDPSVSHGQAIYRKLTPGRWIVAASGSGALTLAKVESEVEVELTAAPEISAFEPVENTTRRVEAIGPTEVFGSFFGVEK